MRLLPRKTDHLKAILGTLPHSVPHTGRDGCVSHTGRTAVSLSREAVRAACMALARVLTKGERTGESAAIRAAGGKHRQYSYLAASPCRSRGAITGAAAGQQSRKRAAGHRTVKLEALLRHVPVGIVLIDDRLRYTALAEICASLPRHRVKRGGAVEKRLREFLPPDEAAEMLKVIKTVLETGVPAKASGYKISRPDGSFRYIDWELRPITAGKKILGLVGITADVTPHVAARQELEQAGSNLELTVQEHITELTQANAAVAAVLESIIDGFFVLDAEWRITYINKTAERLSGTDRNQIIGRCFWDLVPAHPALQEPLGRVMSSRRPEFFETASIYDGKWLNVSACPRSGGGLVVYFRDITAQKNTEQELLRLCSLDLVGQMAAGISHEVRNPLTTVKGFLQLLAKKPAYTADKNIIELMVSEIDRANDIISQFLSVAKVTPGETKAADINTIIVNLYPLLENACREREKSLVLHTDAQVPPLHVNEKEIRQLLLNLVNNALDAMQNQGRQVTVGTTFLSNREAALYVKDEGTGIPAEIIGKIGTPFLTTKDKGTGLGLATCYAIAHRNNAAIEFVTGPDGTTFTVNFKDAGPGAPRPAS